MTEKAKFKYSAREGVLELEGSEEFVSKHFESLTDLIRIISRHAVIEPKKEAQQVEDTLSAPVVTSNEGDASQSNTVSGIGAYPEYFSEINGKLKIVTDIPGSSGKAKMMNAALLYCYGSKLLGDDQVSSKDIRVICEEHGF